MRLFCKGASEQLLKDCAFYTNPNGTVSPMTPKKFNELNELISQMAAKALRTLLLAHVDFPSVQYLPPHWRDDPPDNNGLCCDALVGIMDPLRSDVKEAVFMAQSAGVTVRMVTGDNVLTAMAIAKDCGILTEGGASIEGPTFRKMSPKDVDALLPTLQVMARSSPDDKHLLVTRLNGHAIPLNQAEWIEKFKDKMKHYDITWETHKDKLLPGHKEEWSAVRPEGGQVVGVTGDGTNDAPALKAADVGLAMGITGTKVAQGAADIVILDDRFSSIVRAMMWGRSVYDNIRKFLQFQLTVNVVACMLVFIGACLGTEPPLNAVQMLWVNLVMDTLGALALGTEPPIPELLQRKPYKRTASLISRPMRRNILVQASFQLSLLVFLMLKPEYFDIKPGVGCYTYESTGAGSMWDLSTVPISITTDPVAADITCKSFIELCPADPAAGMVANTCLTQTTAALDIQNGNTITFQFQDIIDYESLCMKCDVRDYTHGSFIFNAFIWCQIFNELSSRVLFSEINIFKNMSSNYMFLVVIFITLGMQIILIEKGGDFMKTSSLGLVHWGQTMYLAVISLPLGLLARLLFPIAEDPASYFDNTLTGITKSSSPSVDDPNAALLPQGIEMSSKGANYSVLSSKQDSNLDSKPLFAMSSKGTTPVKQGSNAVVYGV